MLGLGIDMSKKKAVVCLKYSKMIESFSVSNDERRIANLLQRVEPYIKEGFTIKSAMESTGNLWISLYDALEGYSLDVSLVNPLRKGDSRGKDKEV